MESGRRAERRLHSPGVPLTLQDEIAMQRLIAWRSFESLVQTATVTGRGMLHLPSDLRKRFGIRPGDKVELRPTKTGIVLERLPTWEEGFGEYPGIGRRIAIESLREKKAELAREEHSLREEEERIRRVRRVAKVRV